MQRIFQTRRYLLIANIQRFQVRFFQENSRIRSQAKQITLKKVVRNLSYQVYDYGNHRIQPQITLNTQKKIQRMKKLPA